MKLFIKVGTLVFALAALTAVSLASDITGVWHGRAKVDLSKIHQPTTAAQKSQMVAQINRLQNASSTLSLKPNHTFSVTVDNDKSVPAHSGTWKVQGNKLVLSGVGNARRGAHDQVFTISADGKSLASDFHGTTFTFKR